MPFPMKIQPVDSDNPQCEQLKPTPVIKSRLKRLFDKPFNSVLKISSTSSEKPGPFLPAPAQATTTTLPEFEPSSVCLDNMVQSFIEENTSEKQAPQKYGGGRNNNNNRCSNCFNGKSNDSSDDEEFDDFGLFGEYVTTSNSSFGDSIDSLKSLVPCGTTVERNLLADTSKIVEKNKSCKRKDELRKIVTDGLIALGFNASICLSKWDKSSSIPAGEYEYIDVIMEGERVLIDIDFRSEFEIARSTGNYKAILQSLPFIFVGNVDRLQQIVAIVSEAARQSLKKKGMHVAPWRKAEYMKAKWLSPHVRTTIIPPPQNDVVPSNESQAQAEAEAGTKAGNDTQAHAEAEAKAGVKDENKDDSGCGEFELIFGEETPGCGEFELIFGEETTLFEEPKSSISSSPVRNTGEDSKGMTPVSATWQLPVIKSKSCERGNRVRVTGLASLLKEKP